MTHSWRRTEPNTYRFKSVCKFTDRKWLNESRFSVKYYRLQGDVISIQ